MYTKRAAGAGRCGGHRTAVSSCAKRCAQNRLCPAESRRFDCRLLTCLLHAGEWRTVSLTLTVPDLQNLWDGGKGRQRASLYGVLSLLSSRFSLVMGMYWRLYGTYSRMLISLSSQNRRYPKRRHRQKQE
jgi:hypothetical protein